MKVVAVTGYKTFELGIFQDDDERVEIIKLALRKRILQLLDEGLEWILISGQIGIELWAGEVVLELKDEEYEIKLGFIPPFEKQSERWQEASQLKYEELTSAADFYKPLYAGPYKAPYQFRAKNKWLTEKSDGALILLDVEGEGSVKYFYEAALAQEKISDYPIHLITPFDLEDIASELQRDAYDEWS